MASVQQSQDLASLIDTTTILSLLSTLTILAIAYLASRSLLFPDAGAKTRILFVWHAFDALIHFCLEGGFLYNCFFSFRQFDILETKDRPSAFLPPNVYFLQHKDRLYGSAYGTNPLSALWREYAKADARWGGSDLTVISLELLTVFVAGPLAVWICYCLVKRRPDAWFWMIAVATGELYGGFMTFAPEWLSGNPNLDASNWMYLWLYLVFFNTLWVWLPLWILYEGYWQIVSGARLLQSDGQSKKSK